jgi:hypothetical protein
MSSGGKCLGQETFVPRKGEKHNGDMLHIVVAYHLLKMVLRSKRIIWISILVGMPLGILVLQPLVIAISRLNIQEIQNSCGTI